MKKAKSDYLIQSVSRALDILEAFSPKEAMLGVTDLAKKLKLHKNNVFRLLATLETRGYVEQEKSTGAYRLGIKLFEVASVFVHHLDIKCQARPTLETLASEIGESVYLVVLQDGGAVYLDLIETGEPIRVASRLGTRWPFHATAAGKAIAAFTPRERVEALLSSAPLASLTAKTLTSKEEILAQLERASEEGCAVSREEDAPGVIGVAAPILDHAKQAAGAIECLAPAFRMTPERISELIPRLTTAAHDISFRMGAEVPR